jgi:hypothetical protein
MTGSTGSYKEQGVVMGHDGSDNYRTKEQGAGMKREVEPTSLHHIPRTVFSGRASRWYHIVGDGIGHRIPRSWASDGRVIVFLGSFSK